MSLTQNAFPEAAQEKRQPRLSDAIQVATKNPDGTQIYNIAFNDIDSEVVIMRGYEGMYDLADIVTWCWPYKYRL